MNKKIRSEKDSISVRLDKWLWAARFYKTRAIAREMVQSGKVHYNAARSKPGKLVEIGAKITIPQGFDSKTVVVLVLSDKRQSAVIAQALYEETAVSIEKREDNKHLRKAQGFNPKPLHRPDKKQRRELIKFKQQ